MENRPKKNDAAQRTAWFRWTRAVVEKGTVLPGKVGAEDLVLFDQPQPGPTYWRDKRGTVGCSGNTAKQDQ